MNIQDKKSFNTHAYVVRTSKNNGIRGYIYGDESRLNSGNTISFAQDTAEIFYQEKPYFTGNNVKVMSLKQGVLSEGIALFLVATLRKAFANFSWGLSFKDEVIRNVIISLPVKTVLVPDYELMAELWGGGGINMNAIDTSSWMEFKLDDILKKVDTVKIPLKKGDCPEVPMGDYTIPARTATTKNQGLSCYVPRQCATVLKNKISVSANGDFSAFWHDDEFTILQDSYALDGNGFELSEKTALFIISAMYRALSVKYNWNNKSSWNKIKELEISLPVKETEEIDWQYMEERIAELERERIAELERYLIVTGLDDYELTDVDKEILATKLTNGGGQSLNSTSGGGCLKEAREFKVGDLFEIEKISNKLAKENLSNDYDYPAYSSDKNNNGIIGYTNNPEFICSNKIPVYIIFGDHTRTFNIARKSFSVLDNVKVLVPCFNNDKVLLYLTNVWKKQIPKLGYARHWKHAKDCILNLPIETGRNNKPVIDQNHTYHPDGYIPDCSYMENYIKAIEKVVIKDVVDYKNEVIEKTKLCVGATNEQ